MSERLTQNFNVNVQENCQNWLFLLFIIAICHISIIQNPLTTGQAGSNGLFHLLSAEMVLVGVATTHVLCDHVGLLLASKSIESGFGDVKVIGSLLFTTFHVSNSCCRAAFAWILAVRRLCKTWWWCNIYCSISYLCDLFCGWGNGIAWVLACLAPSIPSIQNLVAALIVYNTKPPSTKPQVFTVFCKFYNQLKNLITLSNKVYAQIKNVAFVFNANALCTYRNHM